MSYRSIFEFPENICYDPPNFHFSKPQPLIWCVVWGSPSHMSSLRDFQIILSHLHPRVCQCFSTFLFSLSTLIRKLLRNCFSHHTPYEILVPQIYLFMYICTLYRKAKASFFCFGCLGPIFTLLETIFPPPHWECMSRAPQCDVDKGYANISI